ncbi:unnamed protein product [Rhizophagus irregularis]|nr:unnamed protein product [Rhizophagus irregularis]
MIHSRKKYGKIKHGSDFLQGYIWFSSGEHVIYLGFYIGCASTSECTLPSTVVLSQNHWRCGQHIMLLNTPRQSSFVRKDARFYRNQLTRVLTKQGRKEKQNIKEVHSNRLGMSYTVTINKYNRGMGQQQN